jgi:hypothetical protein
MSKINAEIGTTDDMGMASGPVVLTEQQLDEVAGGLNLSDLVLACPGCTSGGDLRIAQSFGDVINPAVNPATFNVGALNAGGFR